jgi:outer membrane protein assembly factor BamB
MLRPEGANLRKKGKRRERHKRNAFRPTPPLRKVSGGGGASAAAAAAAASGSNPEATPIVVNGVMYLPAGNRILALDPESGEELWQTRLPFNTISRESATGLVIAIRRVLSSPLGQDWSR